MVQGERLSAVAKRRRLHEADTSSGVASPLPVTPPISQVPVTRARLEDPVGSEKNTNSFDALVEQDLVAFNSTRTVEFLGSTAVKVRIEKDQNCMIQGRFFLWIRSGTVSLLGASLDQTTPPHRVFHPENEDIPAITCLSTEAVLQVEADTSHSTFLPKWTPSIYTWTVPGENTVRSFTFVLDGMEAIPQAPGKAEQIYRFKEADLRALKLIETHLNHDTVTARSSTTIMCGKRHSIMSKISTGLSNYFVTRRTASGDRQYKAGVLLLDLDLHNPSFSPPGTVSLVHIKKPMFLPAYARHLLPDECFEVLAIQFFDDPKKAAEGQMMYEGLMARLQTEMSKHQKITVVINGWDLFAYLDVDYMKKLLAITTPSRVFGFGTNASPSTHFGELMAQVAQIPYCSLPCGIANNGPTMADSRRALINSYFGPASSVFPNSQYVQLSYSSDDDPAQITAIHFGAKLQGQTHLVEYLLGAHVAILLHKVDASRSTQNLSPTSLRQVSQRVDGTDINVHRTATEGIPLTHLLDDIHDVIFKDNECIGLGVVVHVDVSHSFVQLITPVPRDRFRQHLDNGGSFIIVASTS